MDQIALFDMDNTLCDWDAAMERDLRRVLPEDMSDNISRWLREDRRVRPTWVENLMSVIRTQVNWWKNLEPLEPGMTLLRMAIAMGWSVNILTKGPATKPRAWSEKVEWCADHIGRAPVTVCADKSMVYGKMLVDDYPPYVEKWLEYRPNGLVLMPAHYYNENFIDPRVIRVENNKKDLSRADVAMRIALRREEGEPLDLSVVNPV